MKFAFLVHPLSEASTGLFRLDNGGRLLEHWGGNLLKFTARLHRLMREATSSRVSGCAGAGPRLADHLTGLVSASGDIGGRPTL